MTTFAQPFEDYEILDRVGAGAMGTVFKARQKRLNRIVALKVLKPSLARDKRYVDRLRREARIVASLSHPHIVAGYDLGEEAGYHFFVMEFVEGKSLRQLLVEWGMFAEEYVLKVARQVAEALDHAYQRDVIHRDIKPGNILIDEHGDVKLTDMGLAKGPADLTLTRDGATVGTPMYISPEQARNPQDVDVRSDLYSLGATLYHMATGVPPFAGATMAELITNVLNENVVPPDEANSAVSQPVSLVIRKLLAKNLQVRYQTPRELLDDLDRIARAQPPAVDAGRLDAEARASNRWLRALLYATSTLLLALAAWWVGQQMVEPGVVAPDSEQWIRALDAELAALPSAGARHLRLRTVDEPPSGAERPLERRRRMVADELQAAIDTVVDALQGPLWGEEQRWLREPSVWPDLAAYEQRYLRPRVRAAAGLALDRMPSAVQLHRVTELRQRVERELQQRDTELVERFAHHLRTVLPGRSTARARAGEFAQARQVWVDALSGFCDGVDHPLPERLAADLRQRLAAMLDAARTQELATLDRAERRTATAIVDEVAAMAARFEARLDDGVDPTVVGESLARFRADLGHSWPQPADFRRDVDPWPDVTQQLQRVQNRIDLRQQELLAQRFEARCDLAWRVFCSGDADAALAVLHEMAPATAEQERDLRGHRRCLRAADAVEQAVLRVIAEQAQPPVAFLLTAAEPFALRVEVDGERVRLWGEDVDQHRRALRLTELRLGDLFDKVGIGEARAVRALPAEQRALGLSLLQLATGDNGALERTVLALHAADRTFLLERVWPRIERVRNAGEVRPLDLASRFAALERALANVDQLGTTKELTKLVLALRGVDPARLTDKQRRRLRAASRQLEVVQRKRTLHRDLSERAPRRAIVDVRVVDGELESAITLPAEALLAFAGEGWRRRDDGLEFAAEDRPWAERQPFLIRCDPGLGARPQRTRLELELSFPDRAVGRRSLLVEFDGITVAVVVAGDDSVLVEAAGGVGLDEAEVAGLFEAALAGVFAPARAKIIPGGVHRLAIDVMPNAPTQARVAVWFEDVRLFLRLEPRASDALRQFALHPLQELTVRQVTVRGSGY